MVTTRTGRLVPSEKDGGEEKSGQKNGCGEGSVGWGGGANGGVRACADASLSEAWPGGSKCRPDLR